MKPNRFSKPVRFIGDKYIRNTLMIYFLYNLFGLFHGKSPKGKQGLALANEE